MKRLLLLILALAALVGIAVLKKQKLDARFSNSTASNTKTREYLFPDVDFSKVQRVLIQSPDSKVDLKVDNGVWVVTERDNYPASFDRLRGCTVEIKDSKITGKQIIREGAWKGAHLLKPEGEANKDGAGTLVEFFSADGRALVEMILGDSVEVAGTDAQLGAQGQRFVRIPSDGDAIWMLSTAFYELDAKPESWVDKGFIQVDGLREVSVTQADAKESWTAARAKADDQDFNLVKPAAGEVLDNGKIGLANLLSSASFSDVQSAAAGKEIMKDAVKATLKTFGGFTYEVAVAKQVKDGANQYFMTVKTTAKIPEKREPGKGEKPEDKEQLDQAFADDKKAMEEKLAREQKYDGWVYQVAEYAVSPLLEKRSAILKDPSAEGEAAPTAVPAASLMPGGQPPVTAPSAPQSPKPAPAPAPKMPAPAPAKDAAKPTAAPAQPKPLPKKPTTVTTPPVQVPAPPKPEIKPAPEPNANPATQGQ